MFLVSCLYEERPHHINLWLILRVLPVIVTSKIFSYLWQFLTSSTSPLLPLIDLVSFSSFLLNVCFLFRSAFSSKDMIFYTITPTIVVWRYGLTYFLKCFLNCFFIKRNFKCIFLYNFNILMLKIKKSKKIFLMPY